MKYVVLILLSLLPAQLLAQVSIETRPLAEWTTDNPFSDEWQYLSTDLFLLQPQHFNALANDLAKANAKGFLSNLFGPREELQGLTITASIKDLKFMGSELTFPVYYFKTEKTNQGFVAHTGRSHEVIRLIDKLPLTQNRQVIDATIQGNAITSSQREKVFQMISGQLQLIGQLTSPSSAVLTLVGELGKFMDAQQTGNSYSFESTVRLYEKHDFNQQLHSIKLFTFVPSNTPNPKWKGEKLAALAAQANNQLITRSHINQTLDLPEAPCLMVVNYKSRYISEKVVGDAIDFETIEARKQRIKSAYSNELINQASYIQEQKFIAFLNQFAQFKIDVNNFQLNYNNQLTKDFTNNYFLIIKGYRQLKNTFESRQMEFAENQLFLKEFRPQYESILLNASLYLEESHQLKTIKALVNTLFDLRHRDLESLTAEAREEYLRTLHAIDLPTNDAFQEEVMVINRMINSLEATHYEQLYRTPVANLLAQPANENTIKAREALRNLVDGTHCKRCRQEVSLALADFDQRYQSFQAQQAVQSAEVFYQSMRDSLYYLNTQLNCMEQHFQQQYPDTIPRQNNVQLLAEDLFQLQQQTETLDSLLADLQFIIAEATISEEVAPLTTMQEKLTIHWRRTQANQQAICRRKPALCACD